MKSENTPRIIFCQNLYEDIWNIFGNAQHKLFGESDLGKSRIATAKKKNLMNSRIFCRY